jgi:hypothetical protein
MSQSRPQRHLSERDATPLPPAERERLRGNLIVALRAAAAHAERDEFNDVRAALGDARAVLTDFQLGA